MARSDERHARRRLAAGFRLAVAGVACASLGACAAVAMKGAKTAVSAGTRASYQSAADAGDARAQYEVGASWCCQVGPVDPLHDSAKATAYLCASARQGYSPAQYLLGRIYGGQPIVGLDAQQRAKLALAGAPRNVPVSMLYLSLAAGAGNTEAMTALRETDARASPAEKAETTRLAADWRRAPCLYGEVFGAR